MSDVTRTLSNLGGALNGKKPAANQLPTALIPIPAIAIHAETSPIWRVSRWAESDIPGDTLPISGQI
jgi:hypothetical protein